MKNKNFIKKKMFTIFLIVIGLLLFSGIVNAAIKKGPYLIYPDNDSQMTVLCQLTAAGSVSVAWGTSTAYSSGSASMSSIGNNQYKYTIGSLSNSTFYYYKVTNGSDVKTGSFTSAPSASVTDIKFIVYGDTRSNPSRHSPVAGQILNSISRDPGFQTLTLMTGDWVTSNS